MIRLTNNIPVHPVERARDELAEARQRTTDAARALRGERPASPWRWLGIGLTAGVAVGAAGVVAARQLQQRSQHAGEDLTERARTATATVREKAGDTVGAVRERAGAAAQRATAVARDTATRVRESTRVHEPTVAEPEPDGASTPAATEAAARQPSPTAAGE